MISPEQHAEVKAFYDAENERSTSQADLAEIAKLKGRIARAKNIVQHIRNYYSGAGYIGHKAEDVLKILNEP